MINYTFFQYWAIIFLIPLTLKQKEFPKSFNIIFLLSPFIFYIKKLLSGITNSQAFWNQTTIKEFTSIFPDMTATLVQLDCQFNLAKESKLNAENLNTGCIFNEVRYGPLFHSLQLNLNLDFLYFFYILLYFFAFYFMFLYFKKEESVDPLLFGLIFLSPSFNLTLNQLNIDLLIVIFIYLLFKSSDKYFYFKSFFVFILCLIKQHPVGFLIGLIFVAKEKRKTIYLYFLLTNFVLINLYFLLNDSNYFTGQPRPSSSRNSNGILSISENIWINSFEKAVGYRLVLVIYICFAILIIGILKYYSKYLNRNLKNLQLNDFQVASITWFIFAGIYANYDYRLIIGFLFIIFFKDPRFKFFFLMLLYLSPYTEFNFEIFNLSQTIFKYFIFLGVLLFLIRYLINYFDSHKNIFFRTLYKLLK